MRSEHVSRCVTDWYIKADWFLAKTGCYPNDRSMLDYRLWRWLNIGSSFKETKCFFPAHSRRFNIMGNLRDREVACSTSDHQGSNFEFCAWRRVPSHSSHHPQEVLLAQFSLICAQRWPKTSFISCHLTLAQQCADDFHEVSSRLGTKHMR